MLQCFSAKFILFSTIFQVLLDTTQLYYYMFHKTPKMPLKRVIMVLAASSEFDKRSNNEVKERPTDNVEVPQVFLYSFFSEWFFTCLIFQICISHPLLRYKWLKTNSLVFLTLQLMRQLPQLNENNKEHPLCREYSVKARALLHAHLARIPLNSETLEKDRQQVVAKCPVLIQEMVSCCAQLVLLAYARRSKMYCRLR